MEPAEKMALAALAVLIAVVVDARAKTITLGAVVVVLSAVGLAQRSDIRAADAALDRANHGGHF
jgi:hypothetical protein